MPRRFPQASSRSESSARSPNASRAAARPQSAPITLPVPEYAPVAMTPVGYYAYQIKWNDGHDTGIYPLALLRELSEDSGEGA